MEPVHNGNPYETEQFNNGNFSITETCIVPGIRTSGTCIKRKLPAAETFWFRAFLLKAGFTVYCFDIFDARLSVHSSAQVELLCGFLWIWYFGSFISICRCFTPLYQIGLQLLTPYVQTYIRFYARMFLGAKNICYKSSREKWYTLLCTLTSCCRRYSHKINNLYYSIYSVCLIYLEDGNCNVCRSFREYLVVWA